MLNLISHSPKTLFPPSNMLVRGVPAGLPLWLHVGPFAISIVEERREEAGGEHTWAWPSPTTRAAWSRRRHTSRLSIPFLEARAAPPLMGRQGRGPRWLLCQASSRSPLCWRDIPEEPEPGQGCWGFQDTCCRFIPGILCTGWGQRKATGGKRQHRPWHRPKGSL